MLWALRLGWHIAVRSQGIGDNPRYRQMAEAWGADARRQMFWLLQKRAIVSIPLALAIMLAGHNPQPQLGPQDLLGAMIGRSRCAAGSGGVGDQGEAAVR